MDAARDGSAGRGFEGYKDCIPLFLRGYFCINTYTMKLISREEAQKLELKKFFTGIPCKNGHVSDRTTSTGYCVECVRASSKQYRQSNGGKAARKRYRVSEKGKLTHKKFMNTERGKQIHKDNNDRYKKTEKGYLMQRTADAKYKMNNPGKVNARTARRIARKNQACPSWANPAKIENIYEEASRLTRETNIPHEIDHIIPLFGENVCGLHCEHNLQILTKTENCKKGNKLLKEYASG